MNRMATCLRRSIEISGTVSQCCPHHWWKKRQTLEQSGTLCCPGLWWEVLFFFFWVEGITLMTSAHPYLADLCFLIGIVLLLFRFLTWELLRKHPKIKLFRVLASAMALIFLVGLMYVNHYLNQKEIIVSLSEVTLGPQMSKDFILKVTNNKDVPVCDVNLSICTDNKSLLPLIEITSEDDEPGVMFQTEKNKSAGFVVGRKMLATFTNGCEGLVFGSVNAHATKDFHVKINGENSKINSKVSFEVYDWSKETSVRIVHAPKKRYFQKIKAPPNRYFPKEKLPQKYYWLSLEMD